MSWSEYEDIFEDIMLKREINTYIQEQYVLGLACALREVEDCMKDVAIDNILKREY